MKPATIIHEDGRIEAIDAFNYSATWEEAKKILNKAYLQEVSVRYNGETRKALVDEEGLLKGLKINPLASILYWGASFSETKQLSYADWIVSSVHNGIGTKATPHLKANAIVGKMIIVGDRK